MKEANCKKERIIELVRRLEAEPEESGRRYLEIANDLAGVRWNGGGWIARKYLRVESEQYFGIQTGEFDELCEYSLPPSKNRRRAAMAIREIFPEWDFDFRVDTSNCTVQPVPAGISRRDYFAAMAMQGFTSQPNAYHPENNARTVAKLSLFYADALIAELDKK